MVVSVFGDIDKKVIQKWAEDKLVAFPQKTIDLKKYDVKPVTSLEEVENTLDKEQAMILFGFQGQAGRLRDRHAGRVFPVLGPFGEQSSTFGRDRRQRDP